MLTVPGSMPMTRGVSVRLSSRRPPALQQHLRNVHLYSRPASSSYISSDFSCKSESIAARPRLIETQIQNRNSRLDTEAYRQNARSDPSRDEEMPAAFDDVAGGKPLSESRWHNQPPHER